LIEPNSGIKILSDAAPCCSSSQRRLEIFLT
jgi:hypothetical protein